MKKRIIASAVVLLAIALGYRVPGAAQGISGYITGLLPTGGNPGPVPYVSAPGVLREDASNFCWDATNHELNVGTCSSVGGIALHVVGGVQATSYSATGIVQAGTNFVLGSNSEMSSPANGVMKFTANNGTSPSAIQSAETTVSALQTCNSTNAGSRQSVSDATAAFTAGIGAIVAGTGSNHVPVYCDGTNWRIG